MSQILIEAKPVEVAGLDSPFRHIYLVFVPDQGAETVITARAEDDLPFDFGDLVVNAGGLLASSDVARGGDTPAERGSREIDVGQRDPADVWAVMLQQARNIDAAGIAYELFSDNSNAAVSSVLHSVGIDLQGTMPGGVDEENAPGLAENLELDSVLVGTAAADVIYGATGDDNLDGRLGADLLNGFGGNDVLRGRAGDDRMIGGAGDDRLWGGPDADRLFGGPGDDWLEGNGGADRLLGGHGADLLFGGSGPDVLDGGAGDDQLIGGPGRDVMRGGPGSDSYRWSTLAEGGDTILDFATGPSGDRLLLSELLEGFAPGGSDPADFVALSPSASATAIAVDPDGPADAAPTPLVTLDGLAGVDLGTLLADGNIILADPLS